MKSIPVHDKKHVVVLQMKLKTDALFGTTEELDFRNLMEKRIDSVLKSVNNGWCDGGQIGAGSMEIFFEDVTDVPGAIAAIHNAATEEIIEAYKIAHLEKDHEVTGARWICAYPDGATFNGWSFEDIEAQQ